MEGILITVALLLFTIIIAIVSYMVYNIKMAGMEVNDFWDFIKSTEKLKKLSVVYCNTSFTLSAASWKRIAE